MKGNPVYACRTVGPLSAVYGGVGSSRTAAPLVGYEVGNLICVSLELLVGTSSMTAVVAR
jgi:NADH:ubiquinone oxidoreductase subunit H